MNRFFICRANNEEIYFSCKTELSINIELLQNYLSPCFEILESNQIENNIDFNIVSYSNKNKFKHIHEIEMEPYILHLDRCAHGKIRKDVLWVCYDSLSIAYYADINGIIMFSDLLSEVDYYDLVRLIMSLFEFKQLKKGYIRCHMALLKIDDIVIAMMGNKNSGKTTFLCNILNSNKHTISFVSNDKSYVKVEDNSLYACSAFEYVGIRNITNSYFLGLEKNIAFETPEMKFYWPGDLIRFFDKNYLGNVKIDFLISPSINMARRDFDCIKYGLSYDAFEKIFFEFSDNNHMNWLTRALININSMDTSFIKENKQKIYKIIMDRGIFEISGNPYNSEYLCDFIKERWLSYE